MNSHYVVNPSENIKESSFISNLDFKQDSYCENENNVNAIKAHRPSIWAESVKLYKQRFLMMLIFALCSAMNGVPQFMYTVVADVIACHYGTSLDAVNWTSETFMVAFLPLVFPVMFLIDKKGLKITLIIGAILNFAGSLFQCVSFEPDRFIYVLVASSLYAIAQVFVLSLPPIIAGMWFGPTEVGLACAMGVFGNQLGIALGFIIPPFVIENNCTDDVNISYELSIISYPLAAVNGVILLLTIFVYQRKPEKFPSIAQATKEPNTEYLLSMKQLVTDRNFMFLFLAYGFIVGTYLAMSTLMNEMVLIHFPGEEVDAGWLGAIMVFAGMVGSIIFGALLDKTHKFKEVSVVVFGLSAIFMIGYTFMIRMEKIWIQFLFFTILGVLMTGYIPVGFDFGAEITYPIPEAMSGSLLNASTMIFSIILTNVASSLIQSYGDFVSNIFFTICLVIGLLFVVFMKCELKRTNASNEEKQT